jgi:hypothetical protein
LITNFKLTKVLKTKYLILAISFLLINNAYCQQDISIKNGDSPSFYLSYDLAGLGSNLGKFQPTIKIHGTKFLYTYEQNSYWGEERNKRIDTISVLPFRQTSIDSILEIIKEMKDTTIHRYHFGIMSGGIHFLTVSNGIDTISFNMRNTFDYTALKIANILNTYLPKDKQLWANEKMIVDAVAYNLKLFKEAESKVLKKRKRG